jgi:hypothetical protein
MFAQDPWTGQLYDVPEYPGYTGGLAGGYGFGPLAALIPSIASAIPAIGGLVGGLLRPPTPPTTAAGFAPPGLPIPPLPFPPGLPFPPSPSALLPALTGALAPQMMPPGYVQPPYPGAAPPRRFMYMRCAMWPGPHGLVPTAALSPTPVTVVPPPPPGMPIPGVPPPLVPGAGFHRRGHGRRRRR